MSNERIVAKVFLVDRERRVLVLRRSEWEGHPERSHQPDLPGGLVDPGENELQAAVREVREETGIDINESQLQFLHTRTYDHPGGKTYREYLYLVQLEDTPAVQLSWEHESFDWSDPSIMLETHQFAEFYHQAFALARRQKSF